MDRSLVGWSSDAVLVRVDAWRVSLFCQAIGQAPPAAQDPVPPTFLKALEGESCSSASILERLGVPLRSVLHAEQAFEHLAPVRAGETLAVSRRVAGIEDKRGGTIALIHLETEFDRDDVRVANSRQTVLVRRETV